MAIIELTNHELCVRIPGWNAVLAMRRSVRMPLAHVRSVRVRPEEAHFDDHIIDSWRGIGTYTPRRLAAGLIYLRDGISFYEVRDPKMAIAIDVSNVRIYGYQVRRLVLQVQRESPENAAARIEYALERHSGFGPERLTPVVPIPAVSGG
jgi:hypothetical protein